MRYTDNLVLFCLILLICSIAQYNDVYFNQMVAENYAW